MQYNNLAELFEKMNHCGQRYLILRKFDNFPNDYLENDHDMDVLCEDRDKFVMSLGAIKRNIGVSAYKIYVNNNWDDLDVRFVGDGYYDKTWEIEMLNKRVLNQGGFYTMSETDLYYATIYHCFIQKPDISSYYREYFLRGKSSLLGDEFNYNILFDELISYMKKNKYSFTKPIDTSVYLKKQYQNLIVKQNSLPFIKKIIYTIYSYFPNIIKKHIPIHVSEKIFNLV